MSMISVIGCSYDQELIEEHEKIIRGLEREIEYLEYDIELLGVIIEKYRDALEDIKEENEDIGGVLEEFYLGYLTKSDAIDYIYWHVSEIEDILEEFKIK